MRIAFARAGLPAGTLFAAARGGEHAPAITGERMNALNGVDRSVPTAPWWKRGTAWWRRGNAQAADFSHASRLAVVGELTASIAHEINQPLGAILGNADAADMLLDRLVPPDASHAFSELRQILADIRRDGLRASGVIRHVRTLAGRRELHFERLDANAFAHDTVRLLAHDMQRRRIAIDVLPADAAGGAVTLLGDRGYLEQVLINLLLNAMDAVEARALHDPSIAAPLPPIVLAVACGAHGVVELHVVDAGAGIPPERLQQLFHSFYTSKPHGMGLGLSIARSIMEAHGGWIRASNNADHDGGPGATFRLSFPPADADGR
jgi:signal transduction histidine kinase